MLHVSLEMWQVTGDTNHWTLHTTHYTLHTTNYTLHTTHYTLHRGLRTGDRGQMTEDFKLIWSLSFNWHPMPLINHWVSFGNDCEVEIVLVKLQTVNVSFEAWTWNLPYIMFQWLHNGITETHPMFNSLFTVVSKRTVCKPNNTM
jgi:hypothetical protein